MAEAVEIGLNLPTRYGQNRCQKTANRMNPPTYRYVTSFHIQTCRARSSDVTQRVMAYAMAITRVFITMNRSQPSLFGLRSWCAISAIGPSQKYIQYSLTDRSTFAHRNSTACVTVLVWCCSVGVIWSVKIYARSPNASLTARAPWKGAGGGSLFSGLARPYQPDYYQGTERSSGLLGVRSTIQALQCNVLLSRLFHSQEYEFCIDQVGRRYRIHIL